jgi:hypothetical protein
MSTEAPGMFTKEGLPMLVIIGLIVAAWLSFFSVILS